VSGRAAYDSVLDPPHPLGRLQYHDERNRLHRALIHPPPRSYRPSRLWPTSVVFDQGNSSSCTTQAAIGLCHTAPYWAQFTNWSGYDTYEERDALYRESRRFDPWPGEDYEGTSTDAPFRVLRDRGVIAGWRWLFGEAELREWVTWYGPAAVGTDWSERMFYPTKAGYVIPGGMMMGGHAYRLVQYSMSRDAYRIVNSWGREWGQFGRAWIKSADMAGLLAAGGEAVTVGL